VAEYQEQIVAVYRDAFRLPPYRRGEKEVLDFARWLPRHFTRKGFRFSVALDDTTNRVIGFAYGFDETPGQFWHDAVKNVPQEPLMSEWLTNSFRLVELAVLTAFQGQGYGGKLHDSLLSRLPHEYALLSTMAADTAAFRLYTKRRWRILLDNFLFPGVARPYRIMGLKLDPVAHPPHESAETQNGR
jgi:GNAT superfamily N-acetyltransferase